MPLNNVGHYSPTHETWDHISNTKESPMANMIYDTAANKWIVPFPEVLNQTQDITKEQWIKSYQEWAMKKKKNDEIPPPFKELDQIIKKEPEDRLKRFNNIELPPQK